MQFDKKQQRKICENSLERVLNNAKIIAERALNSSNSEISERAGILLDDLENLTYIASSLWNDAREQIFKNNA